MAQWRLAGKGRKPSKAVVGPSAGFEAVTIAGRKFTKAYTLKKRKT